MGSKAARKRNKRANRGAGPSKAKPDQIASNAPKRDTSRPTPERAARGKWALPDRAKGGAHVDLAHDMIGRLYSEGALTTSQEQAARLFQELRAGYVAELGVPQYKSCLSGGSGGHDSGDGNVEAIRAYRSLEQRIGRVKCAVLIFETVQGSDARPRDLGVLRNALNCVAG